MKILQNERVKKAATAKSGGGVCRNSQYAKR